MPGRRIQYTITELGMAAMETERSIPYELTEKALDALKVEPHEEEVRADTKLAS